MNATSGSEPSTETATRTTTQPFGERFRAALDKRGPLCLGIDPHASLLAEWDLPDDAGGLERFARGVVDAVGPTVAALKPQMAFFERHGSAGMAVLERVVADARAAGALVILDGKRGDIGSTMAGYADAYVDPRSPLCADALTVHPYLGYGSLQPVLERALAHHNGVFVVTMSSNPEAGEVQAAVVGGTRTVAGVIFDHIAETNGPALAAGAELGSIGAVVGATVDDGPEDYARLRGPILAPGLGAQGATPADLARIFTTAANNVLPHASRSVLAAGPSATRLASAAAQLVEECAAALR